MIRWLAVLANTHCVIKSQKVGIKDNENHIDINHTKKGGYTNSTKDLRIFTCRIALLIKINACMF